jgi:hypothetical protein
LKKLISTAALASVIAVGSASAALAGQPAGATDQGSSVSAVAKSAEFTSGKARGEAVSALAKQHGAAISALAKAQGAAAAAAGKAQGAAAADAGQATGTTASEPGRLKAAAGADNQP